MKPRTKLVAVLALASLSVASGAIPAFADTNATVAWTKIGIYPRTSPEMRDDNHNGSAVPDGTVVTVVCETTGQSVTSDVATSDIWESTTIGYIPNAFVETGYNGFTPGVPRCDEAPQPPSDTGSAPAAPQPPADSSAPGDTAPTAPPATEDPTPAVVEETPFPVEGIPLPAVERVLVPVQLKSWYDAGFGGTVRLDWSFYMGDPKLLEALKALPAEPGSWARYDGSPASDAAVFFASGAFSISRTSAHCYAIRDWYDFNPVLYFPEWVKQFTGHAKEFMVRSSGCIFE